MSAMILSDYYKMRELKVVSSHRFDCVASTGEYEPFEAIARRSRDKRLFFYYSGVPDTFGGDVKRKADRAITNGNNISSVFIHEIDQPLKVYGDTKGTNDGLLFLFSEDYKQVEVFVARGYKNHIKALCTSFIEGDLDEEMDVLRNRAVPTNV